MLEQVLISRSDVAPLGSFARIDTICQSQAGEFVCVDRSTVTSSSHPNPGLLDVQNGREREKEEKRNLN
jgi:hypothetical protein